MSKCATCNGWGFVIDYRPDEPCHVCFGRGKVMDFAYVSLVRLEDNRATYRAVSLENREPFRYTLAGARDYAATFHYGNHKPNSIVRVYLK